MTCRLGRARRLFLLLFSFLCLLLVFMTSPVLAAEEAAEKGWGIWETVGRFFNLFLLFGVLIYFVRKPLGEFFDNRRRETGQKLAEAQRQLEEVERKIVEIEGRMSRIDQEIDAIGRKSQQEVEDEARRVEESTRLESKKILAVAQREVDGALKAAQKELRRFAGSLSVGLAEEIIRRDIGSADEERLFSSCVGKMESMK